MRYAHPRVSFAALGIAVIAALVLVLAVPIGASGKAKAKRPIIVGTIYSANTAGFNDPGPAASVAAAVRFINKAGGVNGRKLDLKSCNDDGDPNQSASCARNMVSDHVVATFADVSSGNSDGIATTLNAAHIPQIDLITSSNLQFTCATCFPIGPSSLGYAAGQMKAFKSEGIKKVYLVGVNLPSTVQTTQPHAVTAAKTAGLDVVGTSLEPPGVADWSPIAAQIQASGAQAVWTFLIGADGDNLVKALQEVGYKGKIAFVYAASGEELSALGPSANGQVVSWAPSPPLTASNLIPGVATYTSQMQAEYSSGNGGAAPANLGLETGLAWASTYAFADIAKNLKKITAATVLRALRVQKKPLNMQGFVAGGWAPGAPSGAPYPLQKAGPLSGYSLTLKNDTWYLKSKKPENIKSILKVMLG